LPEDEEKTVEAVVVAVVRRKTIRPR